MLSELGQVLRVGENSWLFPGELLDEQGLVLGGATGGEVLSFVVEVDMASRAANSTISVNRVIHPKSSNLERG